MKFLIQPLLAVTEICVGHSKLISSPRLLLLLSPQLLNLLQKSKITLRCTSHSLRNSCGRKRSSWRTRERREGGWRSNGVVVGAGLAIPAHPGAGAGMVEKGTARARLDITMTKVGSWRPRNKAVTNCTKSHHILTVA